ncbi:ribonuclease H-like domain-containing protein [Tanacetum coccineum]|uniref:Ribonuclease H-like domain-containing protein n=1 Tax=Tanacetum coccineum TaxID=301880 RepID=A0ABQ5B6I0_9ASTR
MKILLMKIGETRMVFNGVLGSLGTIIMENIIIMENSIIMENIIIMENSIIMESSIIMENRLLGTSLDQVLAAIDDLEETVKAAGVTWTSYVVASNDRWKRIESQSVRQAIHELRDKFIDARGKVVTRRDGGMVIGSWAL